MRNLILLKQAIKNILKEDYHRVKNAPVEDVLGWLDENPHIKELYEQGARENFGDKFLLKNISDLILDISVYFYPGTRHVAGIYFDLKAEALEKLGYKIDDGPWVGIDVKNLKFLFKNISKKEKSGEEEASGLAPDEAAAFTNAVQAAEEQGANTSNEIAAQIAQNLNVSNPGGFAQAIAPAVAAAAKTGFDGADLSSLPKGAQQAAKEVAAKSAKSGSSKDPKKVIADFTREVITGMKIQPNRKNASVVDKTLKWLKSQDKLKAESTNHSRAKIRNTL